MDEIVNIPILTIREARNAATGAPIAQVVLSNIHIQGQLQTGNKMQFLMTGPPRNVTIEGDRLRCTLECAFSHDNGDYQFTVSAPGYMSKTVTVPGVRYTAFERDGCTNTVTRGTTISLVLEPAS